MSNEFTGKTAIISGAAGGIGLALAEALGKQGMNIVMGDIDIQALAVSRQSLLDKGVNVLACELDVTDYKQWEDVVARAKDTYGKVHMVINNAGVGGIPGKIEDTEHETWRWVMDVNVMGVLYGAQACVPAIKEHGEGGWVVNVASMAGMLGMPYAGAYCASKAAVVSMTESWAVELAPHNIHVSALCPAFVKTRIHESHRNRQEKYAVAPADRQDKKKLQAGANAATLAVESGIPAGVLAQRVLEALKSKQTYIYTHPNYRKVTSGRSKAIDKAFVDAQESPVVGHLIDEEIVTF
ncbi:short-chain dehydrogenase/reductase SDR [Paraglaciecola sp. T6c]|uniref:SDR family NAD(P)-dependent oxidoreductase n=1 Tax=Pseudoalteromonas atlantica (strain T6c / ATCC BAA-1087) TaxID=3042615 RepID=UPI00005C5C73|nr:SDR family NAD(P)-dependent oxidoreductase [Paraglaciecola sp. T6c]ABG41464.1 short-chain dehydrogenase/reductase SDR [Paraglaciecola sp. T6c]